MRAILTAAVAVLALGACTKADWGIAPSAEELAAADTAKCAEYGYPAGHPEHGACRMMLDQWRAEAEIARQTAVMGNPGTALAGAALLQQAIAPQPVAPRSASCFNDGSGVVTCW